MSVRVGSSLVCRWLSILLHFVGLDVARYGGELEIDLAPSSSGYCYGCSCETFVADHMDHLTKTKENFD